MDAICERCTKDTDENDIALCPECGQDGLCPDCLLMHDCDEERR